MRIIHSCLRYPPASGGTETYVKEIVERTINIKQQRDVRVLTSNLRTHGPVSILDPNLLLDDPIYVQRLHHSITPLISYPRLQALSYYLKHHQPNIIHAYSFWYQPADTAARYARRHNIPFFFHPIYYENSVRQKPIWQIYKKTIGRKTFAAADVVIVISPFEQKLITDSNFPVKRFELIPPGVDLKEFNKTYSNPFLARNIDGPVILSVGRVAAGKGLNDIISVLPQLIKDIPDIQYVVAGENFAAQEKLQQQAKKLGVSKHIHWLGKIKRQELIACYQHAALLAHPSHYEGFGIVLAESLAARTPVVARDTSAIPYVAPNNRAGLLFNSKEDLTQHLLTILSTPNLRKKYGSAGRKHIEQNFSWDKSINKINALYSEFASSKSFS